MKKKLIQSIILFVIAAICLSTGIILIPTISSLGDMIVLFVVNALILVYVYYYLLIKVISKSKGPILILTLTEMIVLTIISVGSIVGNFMGYIKIIDINKIIGVVLWIVGLIESLRAYYYNQSFNKNYPMYHTIINLLLVTFGAIIFIINISINIILSWIITIILLILSIMFIIKGILKIKDSKSTKEITYEILNN